MGLALSVAFALAPQSADVGTDRVDTGRTGAIQRRPSIVSSPTSKPGMACARLVFLRWARRPSRDAVVDDETVGEIESFYVQKRQRDQAPRALVVVLLLKDCPPIR